MGISVVLVYLVEPTVLFASCYSKHARNVEQLVLYKTERMGCFLASRKLGRKTDWPSLTIHIIYIGKLIFKKKNLEIKVDKALSSLKAHLMY